MKKIITISREFGAGGGEIGRRVAQALNYDYYDKELILKAAKESNIDLESLSKWDEKVPMNFGFAQSLFDFYNKPLNEKLFKAQYQVIKAVGEKGNCVIVGRNANTILKEYDRALHVFVHAESYWRLKRMAAKMPEATEAKISEQIRAIDKMRRKYCTYYTNTEFGVADYYDISFNTSKLGIDACVKIICDLAKSDDLDLE
ncbi:cytidylate kinase [Sporanaerobium hydrogeniformans]|uniref:Cytidylate kinase n=1 Tax=Sporanaerobium hydrogeniformans TaxID=3072179 RepID=A0AC61DDK5_9FIRM|nr:cytidylate kinase-like family protein [Sporanaerobium hydrogeniformans]PHV70717.1 cytidylate kinase [Sporanaerobium hydrogeniformans]